MTDAEDDHSGEPASTSPARGRSRPSNPNVTAEELDYIDEVLRDAKAEFVPATQEGPAREGQIVTRTSDRRMLELLQYADPVQIQAEVGDYRLIFHPQLEVEPETEARQMRLGYPTIVEKSENARCRRIRIDEADIHAADVQQELNDLMVDNISATGVAVTVSPSGARFEPGETLLTLELKLPQEDRWFACRCRVVWVQYSTERTRLALRFENLDAHLSQNLNYFIYEHSPEIRSAYENKSQPG